MKLKLPSELTTVTPLSKGLAAIVFITLPFISFFCGMRYQEIKMQEDFVVQTVTVTKQTPQIASIQYASNSPEITYEIQGKDFYKIENGVKERMGGIYEKPSPDRSKKIILVNSYLSSPLMFIEQNGEMREIGWAEEIDWSHNSKYIVYTSKAADAGPTFHLNLYDTTTNKIISMKEKVDTTVIADPKMTSFHNPQWLSDDSGITVEYKEYDDIPYGNIIEEGTTTILIQ